jgi:hypothetical protein
MGNQSVECGDWEILTKSSLFSSVVVAAVTSFAHVWWSPTILGASETNRAHATARTCFRVTEKGQSGP